MNDNLINKIINDLNPKNCLVKFQNPSKKYVLLITGILYVVTIVVSILIHRIDLPYVSFHKEALFDIPQTMFNTTILTPILEEIFFFGIPISLVNNPIAILAIGSMWSILHLFVPFNTETYSLTLDNFIATLPILFIHFKLWRNGFGWISIIFHCVYNTMIQYLRCAPNFSSCQEFNTNNFEFPEFYIYLGITLFSIYIVYFLQRRKEEREYIAKVLRKKKT